jgi:chromosome partition protein MukF
MRLLRELEARVERPPVEMPRTDRETAPEWVEPENALAELDAVVAAAIKDGARTLAEVTAAVLPRFPESTRYAATGRVADALARLSALMTARERPWKPVGERLEIEDWTVRSREEAP